MLCKTKHVCPETGMLIHVYFELTRKHNPFDDVVLQWINSTRGRGGMAIRLTTYSGENERRKV